MDSSDKEYLKKEFSQLVATCMSCPHRFDIDKDVCICCEIMSRMRRIREKLMKIRGLERI